MSTIGCEPKKLDLPAAHRRRGLSPNFAAGSVLVCAALARLLTHPSGAPQGMREAWLFWGTAGSAAAMATLFARWLNGVWGAVVLGVAGAAGAAAFPHSVPIALVGWMIAAVTVLNVGLRLSVSLFAGAICAALGFGVGALSTWTARQGGAAGWGQAAGVVFLGVVMGFWLIEDRRSGGRFAPRRALRRMHGAASLLTRWCLIGCGAYLGARFGAPLLSPF